MKTFCLLSLGLLVLTGCSSPMLHGVTTVLAGGAGAAGGALLGKGRPEFATGGAALGVAASELFHHQKSVAEKKAFRTGYEQALGDQARSEYWRQLQQHLPTGPSLLRFPVPQPERITPDGVRLQPNTQFIEIHQ